jgi:hypothetical protein
MQILSGPGIFGPAGWNRSGRPAGIDPAEKLRPMAEMKTYLALIYAETVCVLEKSSERMRTVFFPAENSASA